LKVLSKIKISYLENCKLTHKAEFDTQYKIFLSLLDFIEDNQKKQEKPLDLLKVYPFQKI
jgi:hypothetical protein